MYPLWQSRQVVTINGMQHVDWCMVFGSQSSPWIWCTFMGLIIWITINVCIFLDLLHYMDNVFGYEYNPIFYAPYNDYLLAK